MDPLSVVRWTRAAGFAATCTGLAVLGHLAGGGAFDRSAALTGFLLVLGPALALTGRERSLASIIPATGVSQVVLHLLLTRTSGGQNAAVAPGMDVLGDGTHHGGLPGLGMLLMHAVSVLVTSAWLEWGEARLCALARVLAGWVVRPLLLLLVISAGRADVRPRPIRDGRASERAPAQAVLRYAVARRGPPGTWTAPGATA
ncbi:hypothetical protein E1264_00220 [Actinomadura sp. KC216]|uniref:hypothetical protein n=1 Tax=Actinomadura sp. KC216 TaxID=2530370 RepID=UPI00104BA4F0|nr:hypothetical protein [Actinomadura sp. KC216]TDB91929.1 hypothetical protein E1264_00220 [Actinomadura sp. KC216]